MLTAARTLFYFARDRFIGPLQGESPGSSTNRGQHAEHNVRYQMEIGCE